MTTFLDYARRGRNQPWWYVAVLVLAMVSATVGGAVFEGIAPGVFANREGDAVALLATSGMVFGALLAGVVIWAWLLQQKTFGDIIGAWDWRWFGAGVGIWGLACIVSALIDFAIAPHGFRWTAAAATGKLVLVALLTLPVQTFTEEFIFRGYLTQGLLLWLKRPIPAAVISGCLFGSLHIPNGYAQAVAAAALGIVASLIAIRTGGIAFTYGMHLINNLFGAIVVVSADDVFKGLPALITQNTPFLTWWDSAVELVLLALLGWFVLTRLRIPDRSGLEMVGG